MRLSVVALGLMTLPLPALAQQVIVRTDPPRATLVCDGRVVGITPVAFDPTRAATCTLFARGHANLAFDPSSLTGVIASYRLEAVTPSGEVACGAIDPRTGLFRVCFDEAAPRRRRRADREECGHLDPRTGLMNVCLGEPSPRDPAPPRRTSRTRAPRPSAARRCGGVDPATGLLEPCFD
jgi:hypothetical protein